MSGILRIFRRKRERMLDLAWFEKLHIPRSSTTSVLVSILTPRTWFKPSLKAAIEQFKPIMRPSKRHAAANMKDALAAMEHAGSIHFQKTLSQSAIPALPPQKNAYLALPAQFVRENADKYEEWVILRSQASIGRSSRPWVVRLWIDVNSGVATNYVRFADGWRHFAACNGLRMGDSLIFLLKEGARSEFEVHVFRGPEQSPYFPDDVCVSSTALDEDKGEEKHVSNSKEEEERIAHKDSPNRASTRNGRAGKAFPGFRKLLGLTSIRHSASSTLKHSGQFVFPRDFVKTHGEHFQASVQLQGVHEDSPVYVILCYRSKGADGGLKKIYLNRTGWMNFVKANRLKVMQELQFSLIADSYFKVRVV